MIKEYELGEDVHAALVLAELLTVCEVFLDAPHVLVTLGEDEAAAAALEAIRDVITDFAVRLTQEEQAALEAIRFVIARAERGEGR